MTTRSFVLPVCFVEKKTNSKLAVHAATTTIPWHPILYEKKQDPVPQMLASPFEKDTLYESQDLVFTVWYQNSSNK